MKQSLRKFTLVTHIVLSVGWLGAVLAYLALAIVGLINHVPQTVQSAYISMGVIGRSVIVPIGIAAVGIGLVESLGTQWGLFRHWWVTAKFLLTTGGLLVLLRHM